MAKPTGHIDASDGGVVISDEDHQAITLQFRHPNASQHWHPSATNRRGPYVQISRQLTVDVSESVDSRQRVYGMGVYQSETTTGAKAAEWETFEDRTLPQQIDVGTVSMTGEKPRRTEAYYACEASTAATSELLGVGIGTSHYYDYDDSGLDPESTDDYELFGDNVATWSPFNSNEFADAFLGQTLLGTNVNRITYDSKQFWSLPV